MTFFYLGNITTLTVVRCKKLDLKGSFLSLISLICLFDIFLILNNIFIFSLPIINPFYRHQVVCPLPTFIIPKIDKKNHIEYCLQLYPVLVPWVLPLAQICLTGSVLTIITIAMERLYCVVRCRVIFTTKT